MGEVSSIVSLTKQQIAVYKMAQKPTPQNKVDGTILLLPRIEVTMSIDFESLIDYVNKKRLEELDDD